MEMTFICPCCRKECCDVKPHAETGGIISVRTDGVECCSEFEGEFISGGRFNRFAAAKQARSTRAHLVASQLEATARRIRMDAGIPLA